MLGAADRCPAEAHIGTFWATYGVALSCLAAERQFSVYAQAMRNPMTDNWRDWIGYLGAARPVQSPGWQGQQIQRSTLFKKVQAGL